jgi:hypothetical protein
VPDHLIVVAPSQMPLSETSQLTPLFAVSVGGETVWFHTLLLTVNAGAVIVQMPPILITKLPFVRSTAVSDVAVSVHGDDVTVVTRPELIELRQLDQLGPAGLPSESVVVATAPEAWCSD